MIHPFADGNGRTARLLMNMVVLKGGYPSIVTGPEERKGYLDGLDALSLGRDPLAHRQFMTGRLDAAWTIICSSCGAAKNKRRIRLRV